MKPTQEVAAEMEMDKTDRTPSLVGDLMVLTKARLSFMVLITTFVGYFMAALGSIDPLLLFNVLIGTGLVAAGAAVLNQSMEFAVDGLMERTKTRPIPAGRIGPASASRFGVVLGFVGGLYLWSLVNGLSAALALATLVIYVAIYTPMKRRTPWSISVGAVSGAIPPVIGWTAAGGGLDVGAAILFGILFLWQMPHFLAIGWMYREQYAGAGFFVLPRKDPIGSKTAFYSVLGTVALVGVSVTPYYAGLAGGLYFYGALVLGLGFTAVSLYFMLYRDRRRALMLFLTSVVYLPLLLGLMMISKP